MSVARTLLLGLCIALCVYARRMGITHLMHSEFSKPDDPQPTKTTINGRVWNVYYHACPVDHFAYHRVDDVGIRYLVNNDYYQNGGPIFFYTGNEGNIVDFVANTGIMMELAGMFRASLIFAEHRYYGESHPFGANAYLDVEHLGYLTSTQALADYATLLNFLMSHNETVKNAPTPFPVNTKIISFGGSYGGMLSAWFRMKYPHLVTGAWASSAPLKYFEGGNVDRGAFDKVTTRTFMESGCNTDNIQKGWQAILNYSTTSSGRKFLNDNFHVNKSSTIMSFAGGQNLNAYIREALEYMAMTNYPYPTNFLKPMPAYPVQKACEFIGKDVVSDDEKLILNLFQASNIYYNFTGNHTTNCIDPSTCGDPGTAELGDPLGWPWQECTELPMKICAKGGRNDMFWDECGESPLPEMVNYCKTLFGSRTFGWMYEMMNLIAVKQIYGFQMSAYSNIILTQGHFDPWSNGGFTAADKGINGPNGVYYMEIGGSAHHLDLRDPNTCDPDSVKNARFQIVNIIQCWLTDGCQNPVLTPLPAFTPVEGVGCEHDSTGYPWGQTQVTPTAGTLTGSTPSTPAVEPTTTKSASSFLVTLSLFVTALFTIS